MRFGSGALLFGLLGTWGSVAASSLIISCTDQTVDQAPSNANGDDDDDSGSHLTDAGKGTTKSDAAASTKDGSTSTGNSGGDDDDDSASDGGTTVIADSGPASDSIQVVVEPSDKGAALLSAVTNAKKSVHLTMYLLTDYQIIDALLAQHSAGHEVKVVLNENFPSSDGDESGSNSSSYAKLKDAGVDVTWASANFTYTHEKCYILDGTTAWIDTMNASVSAKTENREYLVPDTDPEDVGEAEAIFEADHALTSIKPSGKLLVSPVSMRSGLESLIASATKTMDFEVEEFDDGALATAACAAVKRGVKVRGVLAANSLSSSGQSVVTQLKGCKATIESLASPYIHAKTIVVDSTRAYIGSANFSSTSLDQNRELGLITADATAVGKVNTTLAADITAGTSY